MTRSKSCATKKIQRRDYMEQKLAYSFHLGSDKNKSKLAKKVTKESARTWPIPSMLKRSSTLNFSKSCNGPGNCFAISFAVLRPIPLIPSAYNALANGTCFDCSMDDTRFSKDFSPNPSILTSTSL